MKRGEDLGFDLAAQERDFDVDVDAGLPAFLGGALGGRLALGLFGALFLHIGLGDARGEKTHFLDAGDRLVLAAHVDGALGLVAAVVESYIVVTRHNNAGFRCI